MKSIEATNIQKKFKTKTVLQNVQIAIDGEKIIALIGRNGVGKSTLLKLIAGIIPQTSGELKIFGEQPFDNLYVSSNSIYIHPEMAFPPSFTIQMICKTAEKFYLHWNQKFAEQLINYFQIPVHTTISQLSTGMRQQFFTIFGLATRCALTILDEPVNGLDEASRKDIYRVILKDYLEVPRTIILSSHLLDEMEHLVEEVAILHKGEIIEHENSADLVEKYAWMNGEKEQLKMGVGPIQKHLMKGYKRLVEVKNVDESASLESASLKEIYLALTNEREGGIDDIFGAE
ncbi:MAG: ABC transporter ATP-binding protein [Kurthia sp.]|nr:ABC transporter ATP-binding protein [Candidatus Kurthia equi]